MPMRKVAAFVVSSLAWLAMAVPSQAQLSGDAVKIGVLNDMSGPYADITGASSVAAVQMAVEDFGGSVLGRKIEVIAADHQNKADVGASIARRCAASWPTRGRATYGSSSTCCSTPGS